MHTGFSVPSFKGVIVNIGNFSDRNDKARETECRLRTLGIGFDKLDGVDREAGVPLDEYHSIKAIYFVTGSHRGLLEGKETLEDKINAVKQEITSIN